MSLYPLPDFFESMRPPGMDSHDDALWSAFALAASAAHRRLSGEHADRHTPAALAVLAQEDATTAAGLEIARVVRHGSVFDLVCRAVGREGLDIARGLMIEARSPDPAGVKQ